VRRDGTFGESTPRRLIKETGEKDRGKADEKHTEGHEGGGGLPQEEKPAGRKGTLEDFC